MRCLGVVGQEEDRGGGCNIPSGYYGFINK